MTMGVVNCYDAAIILNDGRFIVSVEKVEKSSDHDIIVPECLPTSRFLKNNYCLL